eukprot:6483152-Karenia_brevis.AAC.1
MTLHDSKKSFLDEVKKDEDFDNAETKGAEEVDEEDESKFAFGSDSFIPDSLKFESCSLEGYFCVLEILRVSNVHGDPK